MLVTLYRGANREDVVRTLRDIQSAAQSAGNVHGQAQARLAAYLEWATNSIGMLEHRVSPADIDRLVLTRSYDRLLAAAGSLTGEDIGTQRVLNGLVSNEIQQRWQVLDEAIRDLDSQGRRWPQGTVYAVADTSFYIDHDSKLRETDFAHLLSGVWHDKPVTIIVPIIVLDELDGLKQRGGTAHVKWRASYTLAVFDDIFTKAGTQTILRRPTDDGTRGPVLMDILYDPPHHERLPINDDEIIDRALAAQNTAGSRVTLLTYDTSQAARARRAGLAVNKLSTPLGDEPEGKRGRK
jgi:PIN domain